MKEATIVLNTMSGEAGEVLDRNRTHTIRKNPEGKIQAIFMNKSQEENAVKLTLTALNPAAEFDIMLNGKFKEMKRANAAGILEFRIVLPMLSTIEIKEN